MGRFLAVSEPAGAVPVSNKISGSVPDFVTCPKLRVVDLHNNRLAGELPLHLVQLRSTSWSHRLSRKLVLHGNDGFVLTSLAGLDADIQSLDLSHCGLVGPIPE